MAKTRSAIKKTANKGNQVHVPLRECSVKLTRLRAETIDRFLGHKKNITHDLKIRIRRNVMHVGEIAIVSKNNTFDIQLKSSLNGLRIVESSSRILRPRPNSDTSCIGPCKTNLVAKEVVRSDIAKIQSKSKVSSVVIASAWRKCKKGSLFKAHVGDIVMAKLSGHSPWPAVIVDFVSNVRAKVEFFGADANEKIGYVNVKEITPFSESAEVISALLERDCLKFKKSINEAELISQVPRHISIFND